ncbi:MAG: helix-turn-helix domain-containing protein, partial [Candidatus Cryptobacteroides sp.]
MVYALIYGYSMRGQGCFYGSLSFICEVCGISRSTAINILKRLTDSGLISKSESLYNGVKYVTYKASPKIGRVVQKLDGGSVKSTRGVVQKLDGGSVNFAPNNKDIYINKNNKEDNIYISSPFNFKTSLLKIGVSDEVASAWMQVRKTKRATNTEIAFRKIEEEIRKSGMSADECIRKAVENSWSGFRAEWCQEQSKKQNGKESVFEHNLKVVDRMFGTNLHEQNYGGKGGAL